MIGRSSPNVIIEGGHSDLSTISYDTIVHVPGEWSISHFLGTHHHSTTSETTWARPIRRNQLSSGVKSPIPLEVGGQGGKQTTCQSFGPKWTHAQKLVSIQGQTLNRDGSA